MEKDLVRASILLVDDEFVIRKSLAKELRAERFSVTDVASGIDAIGALQKLQFNIVITDLMMEGIDGFGVLKAVKELAPLTRIIVITGYGDLRTAIDAMHLGADDFLVKPFEVEELIFRIRRCLEKRNLIEMLMEKTQLLEKEIQRRGNMEERLLQSDNRTQEELRKKVQELTDELQETKRARLQGQHEAGEVQQVHAAKVFGRLESFFNELEDSPLTEQQRRLIADLRDDLEKLR